MKKLFWLLLFVGFVSFGQTTIAAWTIPTISGVAPTSIIAECGVYSTTSNLYADGTNGSSNWLGTTRQYFTGVIPNVSLCGVTTATGAYSLQSPASPFNNNFSVVYKIPTIGYRDLILTYNTRGTLSGYTTHTWSYSTDGITFTPHSTITGRNVTSWSTQTVDFSIINGLNNLSNVYIRLTVSGAIANGSNNRFDNINFIATPLCSTSTTLWNGTSWNNGTPTSSTTVIIDGDYDTNINGNIDCCSMIVNPSKTLIINSGQYVNIQNDLTNNGTVNVLNNGSLIQVNNNGVNTGNISYNRNVNSLYGYDYIYWSSPVIGQTFTNLYSIPTMGFIYQWNPTFSNTNGTQGNWESLTPTTPMTKGKGYIIRASSSYGWTGNLTSVFTGVPNNGNITIPIQRGNLSGQDDNYNLIGNPYPSSINIMDFLFANVSSIDGYVNLWRHLNAPTSSVSPFYGNFQYNYTNDYITINGTGASDTSTTPYYISSGQGFFVNMLENSVTPTNIIFNNSMRNKTYNNSIFYRNRNQNSRIWVDFLDSSNNPTRILIGYVDGATKNIDRMYDAITNPSNKIYSIIDDKPFNIQGRSLPFKKNDKVKLGINITTSGVYKIAIAEVDGVFNTQDIYLEDRLLNITYDLKSNPYTFTSNVGVFNDRFVLKYKTNNGNDNKVNNNIKKVSVYDMMGVKVFEGDNEAYKNMVPVRNHIYIVKTEMEDGLVFIKKISGL